MAFYDLHKEARQKLVDEIYADILKEIPQADKPATLSYFSDVDTYIRKTAYLATGRIYKSNKALRLQIISQLDTLLKNKNENIRQTAINAGGEIGMHDFEPVEIFFEVGLFDPHHKVRNAVIGSIKKMSQKNPIPVLAFARRFLHHPDKEIRREICHGIELRGRTHPQDILPLLKELQFDKMARVKNTLVHVLGQIAYKKGCLATVVNELKTWQNPEFVEKALEEIIDVHHRYRNFAAMSQAEAIRYIESKTRP